MISFKMATSEADLSMMYRITMCCIYRMTVNYYLASFIPFIMVFRVVDFVVCLT